MTDVDAARSVNRAEPAGVPPAIEEMQHMLGALGYPTDATGRIDRATRDAILEFQYDQTLPQTGRPDAATQRALLAAFRAAPIADEGACRPSIEASWNEGAPRVDLEVLGCHDRASHLSLLRLSAAIAAGGGVTARASVLEVAHETRIAGVRARVVGEVLAADAALGIEAAQGGARFRQQLGATVAAVRLEIDLEGHGGEVGVSHGVGASSWLGRTDVDRDGDPELEVGGSAHSLRGGVRIE